MSQSRTSKRTAPASGHEEDTESTKRVRLLLPAAPILPGKPLGTRSTDPDSPLSEASSPTDAPRTPPPSSLEKNPEPATPAAVIDGGPAVSEVQAIRMLHALGVEPGSLVDLNLAGLNAIYRALTEKRTATAQIPHQTVPEIPVLTAATQNAAPTSLDIPVDTADSSSTRSAQVGNVVVANAPSTFPTDKDGVLQLLNQLNVPTGRVSHMDMLTLKRIHSMMTFADTVQHYYAVDNIKVPTDWGIPTSFNDASNILCEKGTSKRLTLWILGEVASQFWFAEDGYPAKRVGLSVQPFSSNIHDFCKRLLHGLCMPRNSSLVADGFGPDQVRATHWMTRRGQKGQPSATDEFTDFYDARSALKDKTAMAKLSVEQIIEHDVVLLEVHVGRYNAEGASEFKGKKRTMTKWQSFFDLRAVYLVKNAAPVALETNRASFVI